MGGVWSGEQEAGKIGERGGREGERSWGCSAGMELEARVWEVENRGRRTRGGGGGLPERETGGEIGNGRGEDHEEDAWSWSGRSRRSGRFGGEKNMEAGSPLEQGLLGKNGEVEELTGEGGGARGDGGAAVRRRRRRRRQCKGGCGLGIGGVAKTDCAI